MEQLLRIQQNCLSAMSFVLFNTFMYNFKHQSYTRNYILISIRIIFYRCLYKSKYKYSRPIDQIIDIALQLQLSKHDSITRHLSEQIKKHNKDRNLQQYNSCEPPDQQHLYIPCLY